MMGVVVQEVFHLISAKSYSKPENYDEDYFNKGLVGTKAFFEFFEGKVDIKQKTVLDVGCGYGDACIYMALNGAKKVVGIDINQHLIDFVRSKLIDDYPDLLNVVDFRPADDIGNEKFDIVLSKMSFEHYADPEKFIFTMQQSLKKEGIIVVGFGPLWKSPFGGHMRFMIKVPWAHLLFPESVIMSERKRFLPDEDAQSFEQVVGGLNKMTLARFLNIIEESGLEIEYFKTNASRRRLMNLANVLRRIPFCREFFTLNVYTILHMRTWLRPSPPYSMSH